MWVDDNESKIYTFIREDKGFYTFKTKDGEIVHCRPTSLSLCKVISTELNESENNASK
jgi:hypothetical protein